MNFAHCLLIVFIRSIQTFTGGDFLLGGDQGERVTWKDIFLKEFFMGEENLHAGNSQHYLKTISI